MLTRLSAESGSVYADLSKVELVGAPIWQAGHAQSRELLMASGYRAYILNTPENCQILASHALIPQDATFEQLTEQAEPKERARKPVHAIAPSTVARGPVPTVGVVTRPMARTRAKGKP